MARDVAMIHDHVATIQEALLDRLTTLHRGLDRTLLPDRSAPERGHFLTFRTRTPPPFSGSSRHRVILVDARRPAPDRISGIYHDPDEVEPAPSGWRQLSTSGHPSPCQPEESFVHVIKPDQRVEDQASGATLR